MPKIKIPHKSTHIDMTAMTDVAFLLLTFFMLTTKFKPPEIVSVVTPSSIAEIPIPDTDIILISVDTSGRVFFNVDGKPWRQALIDEMDTKYSLGLSADEKKAFTVGGAVGTPFNELKAYINDPKSFNPNDLKGIPIDTADNQLDAWLIYSRITNPNARIAIKADGNTKYPVIKRVIEVLQDRKINKFNLITSLEANPNKLVGVAKKEE